MIDRYISEMKKFIDGNVYNFETPEKIDVFINKRGLHDIFGYYGGASVLSNEVFRYSKNSKTWWTWRAFTKNKIIK